MLNFKYAKQDDHELEVYVCDDCAQRHVSPDQIGLFSIDSLDDYGQPLCGFCYGVVAPTL